MAEQIQKLLGCDNVSQLMKFIATAQSMTTFGHSGHYSCAVEDIKFFAKIALYSLFVHDLWHVPEKPQSMMVDAEINVMRAIKTKVINRGYTPHFAEILAFTKCEELKKYIADMPKCAQQQLGRVQRDSYPQSLFCTFLDLVDSGNALDKFALIFSEYCEFNIKEYITQYAPLFPSVRDSMLFSLVFQVYYTLAVVQRLWKGFRHGDLLPHNIMIKIAPDGEKYVERRHYLHYEYDSRIWNVPFFGVFVKIIDFGHSEIPEEGITSSIKRVGNLWLPDHVTFIIHFESMIESGNFMTPPLLSLFKWLNQGRITPAVSAVRVAQNLQLFRDPETVLKQHAFNMFEVEVPDELIIGKYMAPKIDD